eukprot:5895466-Heterocapsa_arctica.AAC.1
MGAVFLDCSNCYERIPVKALYKGAAAESFPAGQARMACQQYAAPRFVRVAGAAAEAGEVTRGMVVGCGMAVALLQAYLAPLARKIMEEEERAIARTFVDNLRLDKVGSAEAVAKTLVAAYAIAKEGLEKIGQRLQPIKTVILAVGPGARKAVKEAFAVNF